MIIDTLIGLSAGLCISISYLYSRSYSRIVPGGTPFQLLINAHLWMGAISLVVLILIPRSLFPPLREYILPAAGTTILYLLAQLNLFTALKSTEASRISPLLGLKLVFLVAITAFYTTYTGAQYAAVFLAVAAALVLNYSGGRAGWRALFQLLVAILFFAGSDLFIAMLVLPFDHLSPFLLGTVPMAVSYAMAGALMLPAKLLIRDSAHPPMLSALPYALAWLAGITLFFTVVSRSGIIYAAILQSTRGLWNVVIGVLLGHMGYHLIEERHGWRTVLRRVLAALMMTGAVALFSFGGR